ncbi:MAG: TIGR00730 family Rossman fold protein [Chloroflexi bacterium]|nr:TIGR00730 family Rossman fold protein [Chloroflexota bacterium]
MSTPALGRICVFCGSRSGTRPEYVELARRLGETLVRHRIGLVYGGASVGLMGAVADAVLRGGGEVVGVIPEALVSHEIAHDHLTSLHVVGSMHERKAMMAKLSDAFIALPGGFGTFEELFEVVTWAQLGLHRKAFGILNAGGFYDNLLALVDQGVREGFIPPEHRALILEASAPEPLIDLVLGYEPPPPVRKWIRSDET